MEEKERDALDDLFRSKLQDFEVDTMPDDWDAIASRLPGTVSVPLRRKLYYWSAAAVISLLMITGGVYIFNKDNRQQPIVAAIQEQTDMIESQLVEQTADQVTVAEALAEKKETPAKVIARVQSKPVAAKVAARSLRIGNNVEEPAAVSDTVQVAATIEMAAQVVAKEETIREDAVEQQQAEEVQAVAANTLIADASPVAKKKQRRWYFGMGGGSVTAGTSSSLNMYALKNTLLPDPELMSLNSPYFDRDAAKTNIHHNTPITVGVGVSYLLSNRFSLQSGLNYTFLSSTWETNGYPFCRETKQKLHFIGIPLSLSYRIAEWKGIQFYAAAGGMVEMNVAGKLKTKMFVSEGEGSVSTETEHVRMKPLLWSVNARIGASYPLWRFLSIYAEAGAGYYFKNGSDIETIRSEKPFNVNLQAGFRFGF
jgi:hypothetical protein